MNTQELLQQIKEMIEKTTVILDKLDEDEDWYIFEVIASAEYELMKAKTELEKTVAQYSDVVEREKNNER